VLKGNKASPAILDLKDLPARTESVASQDLQDLLASGVLVVVPVHQEIQEHEEKEVYRASEACREVTALPDHQVLRASEDLQARTETRDLLVTKVFLEHQVYKV